MIIKRKTIDAMAAIIFTAAATLFPWTTIFEEIYGHPFIDREVYETYFLYGTSVLEYADFSNLISHISNEFLWHKIIDTLHKDYGVPIEYIFGAITALCLGVFSTFLVKKHGAISLILLINPLVIDLTVSQLRIALAISILGIAYMLKRKAFTYIAISTAPLIHTASILFIIIYASIFFLKRIAKNNTKTRPIEVVVLCLVGILISLTTGPLRETILSSIGDRRIDYPDMASTIMYSSYWIVLFFAILIKPQTQIRDEANLYSLAILALVTMNVFTGGYSTRFLAASFPFLISTIISMRGVQGLTMMVAFFLYATFQWVYWLRII